MLARLSRLPIGKVLYESALTYKAPINLNLYWNMGVYSTFMYALQIFTGLLLTFHYVPNTDLALISVEHISRDVTGGWLIRYVHSNGASMFFIAVYAHIARGLYYGSHLPPRRLLWIVGVIAFILMIIIAFLGYVLPWGQMSFWGATVITNLFSVIPVVGKTIVQWLWGGFSIGNATLNRFYGLHFILPILLGIVIIIHFTILHIVGSNNPLGIKTHSEGGIVFHPYYVIKDVLGLILFAIFVAFFVFFKPNLLAHPDNYIAANPLATPAHIVPEWYFLPFYSILRSVPDKSLGVIAFVLAILVLFIIPFTDRSKIRVSRFKPIAQINFWFFLSTCLVIGWIGGQPIEYPFYEIGQLGAILYFTYFLVLTPLSNIIDLTFEQLRKRV